MVGVVEGLCDVWVDVDHHLPVLCDLLVARLHLGLDEVLEGGAEVGVDDVHQPLLREVGDVLLVWQVDGQAGVLLPGPGEDDLGREAFVLGTVEVRDVLAVQGLLDASHDVLQPVDGAVLRRRQVLAALHRQEVVDLPLAFLNHGRSGHGRETYELRSEACA